RLGLAHHRGQGSAAQARGAVHADRTGFWRRAWHAAGAVGRRIRLWRSPGAAEPYAPGFSGARCIGLERTATPRLLGNRVDQRTEDRRSRLEHTGGNARLLGRRDGPYTMDAGSLAQRRHGLRQGRPRLTIWQARRRARLQRALSAQPRKVSPRRTLGL